jgi:hypothetical protein
MHFVADDTASDALIEAIRALGYDVSRGQGDPPTLLESAGKDGAYLLTTTFDYVDYVDDADNPPPGIVCFNDDPDHPMNPIEVFGAFVSENPEGLDDAYTLVTPETLKQRPLH